MEPFYGFEINPDHELEKIKKILSKYRSEPVSEELKIKIYQELSAAKAAGKILIPFKVVMRKSSSHPRGDCIEVLLDTKV